MKNVLKALLRLMGLTLQKLNEESNDPRHLAIGTMLSNQQWSLELPNLNDYEFKIFSQWGDDGVIQYLIKHITIEGKTFIEFGVEDYMESNTRFLMMNNNWAGFVMDGSEENMNSLRKRDWFYRYDLKCKAAWIDRENINTLLEDSGFSKIGILHIDLDGNDYYVLEAIDFLKFNPSILIMEYNSVFGKERPISVPYRKDFNRTKAHYSNLFFGASLAALNYAAEKKGYSLIGCNQAGNNAYFVRNDLLNQRIQKREVDSAYVQSKFRESRDENYKLSFISGVDRLTLIKGLEVINVVTGKREVL